MSALFSLVFLVAILLLLTLGWIVLSRVHNARWLYPLKNAQLSFSPHLRGVLDASIGQTNKLRVVVVTDYNESAGLGWLLYNVLNCLHLSEQLAEDTGRPIVFFSKGLYNEARHEWLECHKTEVEHNWDKNNWFNNLFEPLEPRGWRRYLQANFSYDVRAPSASILMAPGVYQFDRTSLRSLHGQPRQYSDLWKKYLHPRPHIWKQFHRLKNELFPQGAIVYSVHYRGCDKFPHSGTVDKLGKLTSFARENDSEHLPYDWVLSTIAADITAAIGVGTHRADPGGWVLYVASDEEPFISAANRWFGKDYVVSKPNTIRSTISTSGVEIDTRHCGTLQRTSRACKQLEHFVQASVHRGNKDASGHYKGVDVLVETMLLSSADIFYRSRGNFSDLPQYMHMNPAQQVVDLVSRWSMSSTPSPTQLPGCERLRMVQGQATPGLDSG